MIVPGEGGRPFRRRSGQRFSLLDTQKSRHPAAPLRQPQGTGVIGEGPRMIGCAARRMFAAAALGAPALAVCATQTPDAPPAGAAPPPAAALPSSIPARDLVGRWGYASYHNAAARAGADAAA